MKKQPNNSCPLAQNHEHHYQQIGETNPKQPRFICVKCGKVVTSYE